MNTLHSRISFYTTVSVLVIFISTTLFVCWKLDKSFSEYGNPSEDLLLVNKWTQTGSLQVLVESFILEKQKRINSMKKRAEIRDVNLYLDSIVHAPSSPGLSQSALHIPNHSVYSTIKSRTTSKTRT